MWQSTENIVLVGMLCFCPHSQPQEKPYNNNLTVKLPVPKCKRINSRLQGGGGVRWQESNHKGYHPRTGLDTSTFWKRIYCMQLLSNDTCSSMSMNVLCILWVLQYVYKKTKRSKGTQKQTKRNKETKCHVFTYKRLKIMENYKTVRAKRGCGHLREVFIYVTGGSQSFDWEKLGVLYIVCL